MRARLVTLRCLGWLALVLGLLAVPTLARADQLVHADFDGDGQLDRASVDGSSSIRVWLSSTGQSRALQTTRPLLHLAVRDLDGDGRPELIAVDGSARLLVWKTHHRVQLKRYRPKRAADSSPTSTPTSELDDDPDTAPATETSRGGKTLVAAVAVPVFGPLVVLLPRRPRDARAVPIRRSSRSHPRAPPSRG